jgi:YbbR domain-containing protein
MNTSAKAARTVAAVLLAIALFVAVVVLLHSAKHQTASSSSGTRVYADAGIQMDVADDTLFAVSSDNGVTVMLHPISRGQSAEPDYRVKIDVGRISESDHRAKSQLVSHPLADDFNRWLNAGHPELSIRKDAKYWHLRKDISCRSNECLFVSCSIMVTPHADADLSETQSIVESIRATR